MLILKLYGNKARITDNPIISIRFNWNLAVIFCFIHPWQQT